MKKTILLLFIVCAIQTNAQEQWSMNIYFEDATGATDMITFGYDPAANQLADVIEPQFGENWQQIDTTQFNVYVLKNTPPYYAPIQPPIDTNIVMKKLVTSFHNPYTEIGWVHGELPITITWDDPKLNSPNLPPWFTENTNCPRARIDLWFDFGFLNEPSCIATIVDPYQPPTAILTNSNCTTFYDECTFNNEIILDGPPYNEFGNEIGEYMWDIPLFLVVPFNDHYWDPTIGGLEDFEIKTKIYPNPIIDILTIEREVATTFTIKIYDLLGREMLTKTLQNKTNYIDLETLNTGVYVLKINDNFTTVIKK